MRHPRPLATLFLAAACVCSSAAHAGLITLDLCPAGTTSNQTLYGTVLSGGVANWSGASYRDYEFNLSTASGTTSFDEFSILLSAQLRNQTLSYGNTLRASLWTGPIVANPLLADALTLITVPNNLMTASGYSPKIELTGSTFTAQTISTAPSTFFFRVWAEGTINQGYQTKMATTTGEMMSITMQETVPIIGTIDIDTDSNGSFDLVDPMAVTVPEIDPAGLGSVLTLITGVFGLVERRRLKAA